MTNKKDTFIKLYNAWIKNPEILLENSYEGLSEDIYKNYKKLIGDIQRNYNSENEFVWSVTKKVTSAYKNEEILFTNLRAFLRINQNKITHEAYEKAKTLSTLEYSKWVTDQNVNHVHVDADIYLKSIEEIEVVLNRLKSLIEGA